MILEKFDYREHMFEVFENRVASRAIIRNDDLLYMVYVKKENCFIFPGGGVESGETKEETCMREAKEEAGAIVRIKRYMGYIDELWDSRFGDMTYNLKSHYFDCELLEKGEQSLLRYEKEYGFEPIWITASEALDVNLKHTDKNKLRYLKRNIYLLERIKEKSL